ncbi:thymidine kinase [Actinopolymorpha cephalotaxi]|uniref:Thymidine kinase n=1 Tax=Actinopolymorpha cephalotaxi TaxID=504797 RepID=A0A1I2PRC6_9ACTN|nr:thymidine kinase [Actinopolymorpha cephalotaxi]NYH83592.1 thymidine kinase [Actinopolymorpha cephalotaxi]SFG15961.1 thymidine kinase [Actinopolymorpha cephalotaxi]
MADLVFFTGTMDCGKSTLALQMDHNARQRGLAGRLFTCHDRAGAATLSSRLGLTVPAVEVRPHLDLQQYVVAEMTAGARIDYLICDEAQFYSGAQIEQLGRVVDELSVEVYAFGILTDFRTRMFEGSQRLVELADRVEALQVQALCWCGRRGTHNARTVGGVMVTEGAQVVPGDTDDGATLEIGYEVLCRRHHRRRVTAHAAGAGSPSPDVLPFGASA